MLKKHKIEFPLLKDVGNVIADRLGAVRTPEVFLLDNDRVVRYWGRIDDQYGFQDAGVAYQQPSPSAAIWPSRLDEVLAGKTREPAGRQVPGLPHRPRRSSPSRTAT